MAFKEVVSVECDVTISLGGTNKKTGKANPNKIEGYYIGSKQINDPKKQDGVSHIYVFQTPKGNVGVWGKTHLDRLMKSATVGALTRVTQEGMIPTPNNPMYKYKVEVDNSNMIEVATETASDSTTDETESYSYEESGLDEEEAPLDEIQAARPNPRTATAKPLDPSRKSQVQALLNGSRK